MWSLGALLELEDRAKMEAFIVQHESQLNLPPVTEDETMFEYLVDEKGMWKGNSNQGCHGQGKKSGK